ncbi:MAG: response regulator [Rhodocyclaceae bacterium]|nr:response regulator [Rhodocyclaceae bacterium]
MSLTVEGRPLHALIVDDNATARMVAQNIVQSMGWHAECAETGEAALARLDRASDGQASENFDVVLVDWHMGGMDGWETARQLRQRMGEMSDPEVVSKSPLVIMVSSSGHEVFAQKSRREIELLDGYLVKPITGSMLYDSVVDARAPYRVSPGRGPRAGLTAAGGLAPAGGRGQFDQSANCARASRPQWRAGRDRRRWHRGREHGT